MIVGLALLFWSVGIRVRSAFRSGRPWTDAIWGSDEGIAIAGVGLFLIIIVQLSLLGS